MFSFPSEKSMYKNIFEIHLFHAKYSTNTVHLHMYVLNKNTLVSCTFSTKLFKSAKLEQLILYLMQFNCVEVVLKSN